MLITNYERAQLREPAAGVPVELGGRMRYLRRLYWERQGEPEGSP